MKSEPIDLKLLGEFGKYEQRLPDEVPSGTYIDTAILQLEGSEGYSLSEIFEPLGMKPLERQYDGLGYVNGVILENVITKRWFHLFEDNPVDGVIVETQEGSFSELCDACEEVVKVLQLPTERFAWISKSVEAGCRIRKGEDPDEVAASMEEEERNATSSDHWVTEAQESTEELDPAVTAVLG